METVFNAKYVCLTDISDDMIILDKGQIVYIDYCRTDQDSGESKYRIYEKVEEDLPLLEHKWWGDDQTFIQYFMLLSIYERRITRKEKLERLNQISNNNENK